jgi:epoxyqueuosine reductase
VPTPGDLTRAIRARAIELGFDKMGVARAGHADPQGRLRAWLARGFDAGMSYMAETAAQREDATVLMPGARSVIALSISYWTGEEAEVTRARIARYARGDDYHVVVRKKVRKLRKAIIQLVPGARVHPAVDTSPVLERAWAERAGIAWIGKSTMAIAQDLGTYTFLATLVTDVELELDTPHPDRCGSCTACLDACPTGAFVGPHELDARKCITYWNVEHRGAIGPDAPPFFGWIAGCDVCQEVCPWNKFAKPTRERRFLSVRAELVAPDPEALAAKEEVAARAIAGTALQRTGAAAMRRNALRVLEK